MPEGAHPLPDLPEDDLACDCRGGWKGGPKVPADGSAWPLDFAAKHLDMPLALLREVVRYVELAPEGTINVRGFRSQGRIPRAYRATLLAKIYDTLRILKDELAQDTTCSASKQGN